MLNVTNEFYNHGPATIGATGVLNADELRTANPSNTLENNGTINVIHADIQGTMDGTSSYLISGDLTINSNGSLNGGYWEVEGSSSFSDGNCSGQISSSVTFYDLSSSNGGDFDSGCDGASQGYAVSNFAAPVDLLAFSFRTISKQEGQIEWTVANEVAFSYYELEISSNADSWRDR